MGIDDESSHPELCSEVAGGVTRTSVCLFREPDAENLPVRFDEREQEPEPSQTGLRRRGESQLNYPPGDYRHCACSRLYSQFHQLLTVKRIVSTVTGEIAWLQQLRIQSSWFGPHRAVGRLDACWMHSRRRRMYFWCLTVSQFKCKFCPNESPIFLPANSRSLGRDVG